MSPPTKKTDADAKKEDAPVEDPETITTSDRTRELIHELAVGLNKIGRRLSELRDEAEAKAEVAAGRAKETAARAREAPTTKRAQELAKTSAEKARLAAEQARVHAQHAGETARHAAEAAKVHAQHAGEAGRHAAETARTKTKEAAHAADDAIAKARAIALGFIQKAEDTAEHTAERVQEMGEELQERAEKAKAAGKDFYKEHREEILALLITAAKVAAVIGLRRLAASRDDEDEDEDGESTDRHRKATTRRVIDTVSILSAVVGQLGNLLARQPSSLPMLREMYSRGEPSEQAIIGMLLGPALSSDPDHAVEVVHEFLATATSEGAADTIARRTLAPLLTEHPELVNQVTPWMKAAAPFVRRAALLALARFVSDRRSRVGDIVAAAVVVLEDHDEEVRRALARLFRTTATIDADATAQAIAARLDADDPEARARGEELVASLPEDLQERIDAARTDREE